MQAHNNMYVWKNICYEPLYNEEVPRALQSWQSPRQGWPQVYEELSNESEL